MAQRKKMKNPTRRKMRRRSNGSTITDGFRFKNSAGLRLFIEPFIHLDYMRPIISILYNSLFH